MHLVRIVVDPISSRYFHLVTPNPVSPEERPAGLREKEKRTRSLRTQIVCLDYICEAFAYRQAVCVV